MNKAYLPFVLEKATVSCYIPLQGKQKYRVLKLVWRTKLSQCITNFKINVNHRKTLGSSFLQALLHCMMYSAHCFFVSVFPVILLLQALVLHITCISMTTFCFSGLQMRDFNVVVFKLVSVMFSCLAGCITVSCEVLCFYHRNALLHRYLFKRVLFDLQVMVFPY